MSMQGRIGRAGGTKVKRALGVQAALEWAFRVEKAQLELPPPKDVVEEGFGFGLENVLMQRAALGCKVDGGQHKMGSCTHADAEVIAATVAGMPDSLGGIRMAIRVAELARAGLTPDWMPGVVPRCVPVETRQNQHGVRATTVVVGTERVLSRGRWRTVEVLACPVTWRPQPQLLLQLTRNRAAHGMSLPAGHVGDFGNTGAIGRLQQSYQFGLFCALAQSARRGLLGFLTRLAQTGHGLRHDGLNADGGQPGSGGDQGRPVAITGLAPERLFAAPVSFDLFDQPAFGHQRDDFLCGSAMQPLGQRHRKHARAGGGVRENESLRIGQVGHKGLRMQMAAQHALPSTGADHAGLPSFMAGLRGFAVLMSIRFALLRAIINGNRSSVVALSGDREAGHPFPGT